MYYTVRFYVRNYAMIILLKIHIQIQLAIFFPSEKNSMTPESSTNHKVKRMKNIYPLIYIRTYDTLLSLFCNNYSLMQMVYNRFQLSYLVKYFKFTDKMRYNE